MNYFRIFLAISLFTSACQSPVKHSVTQGKTEGWNILTSNDSIALRVIEEAGSYGINHLQLSHHIVMDLKQVKKDEVAEKVNRLASLAHEKNIPEVFIWDHSLYSTEYYPDEFKTGPDRSINLDNPLFWKWIKNDYRRMLDKVPEIDGIILTFIETGAHVEDQYSEILHTEEEKLAAMVDSLASVIIDEYGLQLYIRTFIYTRAELGSLLKALNLVNNPGIKVMTKEVPHDFFLTHPVSGFVKDIDKAVMIEFDCAHEYNGQAIIASIFPEIHLKRWQYYSDLPNVAAYVARTDRTGTTTVIGNPAEINLYAIHRACQTKGQISMEDIYDEFISRNYGSDCIEYLKPAFKLAPEIIISTLYTLGLPLNSHSRVDLEDDGAFQRHVSGKWMEDMNYHLNRGNDTVLHYWKDIVNHLSPPWYKGESSNQLSAESHWVLDSMWLDPVERMNPEYLRLILNEKNYGLECAEKALSLVEKAGEKAANKELYDTTLHVFQRSLITARLYRELATACFAYRVYAADEKYRSEELSEMINLSLDKLPSIINEILDFPYQGAIGQYEWKEDAYRAMKYYLSLKAMNNDYSSEYTPESFGRVPYPGISKEVRDSLFRQFILISGTEEN